MPRAMPMSTWTKSDLYQRCLGGFAAISTSDTGPSLGAWCFPLCGSCISYLDIVNAVTPRFVNRCGGGIVAIRPNRAIVIRTGFSASWKVPTLATSRPGRHDMGPTTTNTQTPAGGVQSVERAFELLELMASAGGSIGVSEL